MNQTYPLTLTIGRQLGSGGREIGHQIAEHLQLNFYDNELLAAAATESGLCKKYFEKADEKKSSFASGLRFQSFLSNDELFHLQSQTILKLASQAPSLFIGRCANYILREHRGCCNLFICAPLDWRIERVSIRQNISAKEAQELIQKTDKNRAAYYNYYTDRIWSATSSYHLCIDSSHLGIDQTTSKIMDWLK